jgi:putative membrane protein
MINRNLEKKLNVAATIVSIAVLGLVLLMRQVKIFKGVADLSFLPPVHAILNTLTALCLMFSFYSIKKGNVYAHRTANFTALFFSSMFLLCYVAYHFTTDETRFGGEGTEKVIYLIVLLTHILLAAVSFPFILFTFIRGYVGDIERHKKMARWVFPIWLYVAITGPICYLMLKPYY